MEEGLDVNALLDYAVFQITSNPNRYEALVCSEGRTEKLASGPLDQLALHLPEAKGVHSNASGSSFRLQLIESLKGSSWFTKSTLARFLQIVNAPDKLKNVNAIEKEMSQLEDTRGFHLALYAKDHPSQSLGGAADSGCLKEVELTHEIKVEKGSSDATKNELLRALDLRLMTLREEFVASLNRAMGATCSTKQISDVVAFSQYFGAINLRNSLLKYLELNPKDQPEDPCEQSVSSHDSKNNWENITEGICQPGSPIGTVKPVRNGISPAKIAQAERQSSTESEGSDSSDEDRSFAERSRPVIRSATPRRSASPMRRIQIGRSGSRRSTTLTIKSLNFFPARERTSGNKDADGNSSGDGEDQPPKKPDNAVRRMSVQDAISLFENKQKDQNLDIQKNKTSAEGSVSTNKSVLRRWSSGMSDSIRQFPEENVCDSSSKSTANNLALGTEEKNSAEVKVEPSFPGGGSDPVESAHVGSSPEVEETSSSMDIPADLVISKDEETNDRATALAEWNRQKEAELNQMLMKMMESKPGRYRSINAEGGGCKEISSEQRGDFSSQYKEKRNEKLRAENAGNRVEKKAQFKVMQETTNQRKAEMNTKIGGISGKQDPANHSQKPRRNSAPPALPKKETSKPTGSRKASPKSSLLPTTRSSWSSTPAPRAIGTPPTKMSVMVSTGTTPNRRKPQATPSPTRPSPRTDRPLQQPNGKKGTLTNGKPSLKVQEGKQQKAVPKNSKGVKANNPASGDDSGVVSAKPSFYNKVTKKGSVVPLESKPFLRKGTGIGPGVGPVLAKSKVSQTENSSTNSGNLIQAEEESTVVPAEPATNIQEDDLVQAMNEVEANYEVPLENDLNLDNQENSNHVFAEVDNSFKKSVELPEAEIQPDESLGISSAAWVEIESEEISASCENGPQQTAFSPELAQRTLSSPRVRYSLSQMLQADSSEPEIIEWGNAENPPALVYQKDAPKGLKRLLKFARKGKGEANVAGWASPSVFSDGEDDSEEPKAASKRSSDALLRKSAIQAKGFGQHKAMLSESFDGGNSSKRAMDYPSMHNIYAGDKLREGNISATGTSSKAARSFFSLSTFRSSKTSDARLR